MLGLLNHSFIDLKTPSPISYLWNFGSLLGACLVAQILTGLFLSMYYCPRIDQAFDSVIFIMRDVKYGVTVRAIHANGASLMFLCLYLHVGRGIYYKSYYNVIAWNSGVVLIFLAIAAAFLGYVLPWGQMSFWGASVITNLLSAVPYVGPDLVKWLWGGFSVSGPTLSRFFALHFILPLIMVAMAALHLVLIHNKGASNPLGVSAPSTHLSFHSFFAYKDLVSLVIVFLILAFTSLFAPFALIDPDNFIPANPLVTPVHIQPEWYFLFAYAILRSIPSKIGGVLALVASILIVLILPYSGHTRMRRIKFYTANRALFWAFVVLFICLTWAGAQPVEEPMVTTSQGLSIAYFAFFVVDSLVFRAWDHI